MHSSRARQYFHGVRQISVINIVFALVHKGIMRRPTIKVLRERGQQRLYMVMLLFLRWNHVWLCCVASVLQGNSFFAPGKVIIGSEFEFHAFLLLSMCQSSQLTIGSMRHQAYCQSTGMWNCKGLTFVLELLRTHQIQWIRVWCTCSHWLVFEQILNQ